MKINCYKRSKKTVSVLNYKNINFYFRVQTSDFDEWVIWSDVLYQQRHQKAFVRENDLTYMSSYSMVRELTTNLPKAPFILLLKDVSSGLWVIRLHLEKNKEKLRKRTSLRTNTDSVLIYRFHQAWSPWGTSDGVHSKHNPGVSCTVQAGPFDTVSSWILLITGRSLFHKAAHFNAEIMI